jgi:hypothetical protein
MSIYRNISLNSPNEKCCGQNLQRKSKHTYYGLFFSFENRAVYDIVWQNILEPGRPQTTIWRMHMLDT